MERLVNDMKLRLNLSTAPNENNRSFLAAAVVVGVVGLIAFLILSHSANSSWQSNRDFERISLSGKPKFAQISRSAQL